MGDKRSLLMVLTDQLPVSEADVILPKLQDTRIRLALVLVTTPLAFVVLLPLLYLVLWASFGTDVLGVFSSYPSLRWFHVVLGDPTWRQGIAYSIALAGIVAATGAVSLTVHFYSIRFMPRWYARLAFGLIALVVVLPSVVYGLALATVGASIGIPDIVLLFIGQLVVVTPIQYFVLESAQNSIRSELLFAGATLGASHPRNFMALYWPMCKRSVWNAIVVGFFLTFDELVIASFVIHGSLTTVPKMLWDRIDSTNDPVPAAISLLLFLGYLLQVAILLLLARSAAWRTRGAK